MIRQTWLSVSLLLLGALGCSSNGGGTEAAAANGGSGGERDGGTRETGTRSASGGASSGKTSSSRSSVGGAPTKTSNASSGGAGDGGTPTKGGTTGSGGISSKANAGGSGGVSSKVSASGSGGSSRSGASTTATARGGATATSATTGPSNDSVSAKAMAAAMGFGANIGNTLENTTTWETGWGQPLITLAFIKGMASRGIKTVRVPVAWDTYAVNGVIEASKMDRVKEVVSWIEAAGMYSIVNIHWDGGWIYNESNSNKYKLTDDVKTKFASYWKQIATAFSDVGHRLIFEGLNEEANFRVNGDPNQAADYDSLNQINQLFVTTVRAQSGYNATRALLIAGFTTDIALTCVDAFTVPNDPAGSDKLFLSIHYYTPYTFCGLDSVESWGSPQTTWGTSADKATLEDLFTKLASFSSQKKIPVILGEFGVTRGEKYPRDSASRVLWMQSVANASLSRAIVPVLWDTGSEIQRTDGSFSTELQSVIDHLE